MRKIRTFDLKNTELFGSQDPYVRVGVGEEYSAKTHTVSNGGANVLFEPLDMKIPVTAAVLMSGSIHVECWDENSKVSLTGDVLIGTGLGPLEGIRVMGESVEVSVQLEDKKGKPAGRLLVFLRLEECSVECSATLNIPMDESFIDGTVHVRKIASYGLQNTELLGMFGEKQDPYVLLTAIGGGVEWKGTTPVLNGSGANNIWDLSGFQFDVTRNQLLSCGLKVCVKDKNKSRGDSVVGEGLLSLGRINKLNNLIELPIVLKVLDKKGIPVEKSRGKLVVTVEIKLKQKTVFVLQDGFKFGKLLISKIQTYNLKNTEFGIGSTQDPYCMLKLGEWSEKTPTQKDGGGDVCWNFLRIGRDVDADLIQREMLCVSVYDKNSARKDCLIGSGEATLLQCGANIGQSEELCVTLFDMKGKAAGRAIITAIITHPDVEEEASLPSTFSDGVLRVKRIVLADTTVGAGFHLSNQDVFIVLKHSKVTEKTSKSSRKDVANASWTELDYSFPCSRKQVQSGEVTVELWSHSALQGDVLVSSALVPIRPLGGRIGTQVEITRDLTVEGGKPGGRVTLLCQLDPCRAVLKDADLGESCSFVCLSVCLFVC